MRRRRLQLLRAGINLIFLNLLFLTASAQCPVTTFPWTETFEPSSTTLSCWTQVNESGSMAWSFVTGATGNGVSGAYAGSYYARFPAATSGGEITKLVSPVLNMSNLTNVTMTFWWSQRSWAGDINQIRAYYRVSSTSPWVQVTNITTAQNNWTQTAAISLPNPSATYQIAIEGRNLYGYASVIDQVNVTGTVVVPCSGQPLAGTISGTALASVCSGTSNLTLTGATTGPGISYTWQSSTDGTNWTTFGGTGTTQTTNTLTQTTYFRAIVLCSNSSMADTTDPYVINAGTPIAGNLITSSLAFTCSGSATLSLQGNSTGTGVNYTWQSSTNGVNWTTFGSNAATQATGTISQTTEYRAIVSCAGSGIGDTSDPVTITAIPLSSGTTTATPATLVCEGTSTLGISGIGTATGLTYQWQSFNGSVWNTFGGTATTQTTGTISQPTQYRAVVTCAATSQVQNFTPVTVAVTGPTPGTISGPLAACENASTTLTLTGASTTGASYQWEVSTDNSVFTPIPGANGTTYTTPALTDTTYYRVTLACASNNALVSNTPVKTLNTISSSGPVVTTPLTITCGDTAVIAAESVPGGYVEWYTTATGGVPFAVTDTLEVTPLNNTTYYAEKYYQFTGMNLGSVTVIDADPVSGDDHTGMALSANYVYLNGSSTGRYNKTNLTGGTSFPLREGFFGDMRNGQLWQLSNGTTLGGAFNTTNVDRLYQLNESLVTGSQLPLSQTVPFNHGNSASVVAPGKGYVILVTHIGEFYHINLVNGIVTLLANTGTALPAYDAEGGATYGWSEFDGTHYYVVYRNENNDIDRYQIGTGTITTVQAFTNLAQMGKIAYDRQLDRVYFHHEAASQFSTFGETLGYIEVGSGNNCLVNNRSAAVVNITPLAIAMSTTTASTVCDGDTAYITFTGTPNASAIYNIDGGADQMIALDDTGVATVNLALTANTTVNLVGAQNNNCSVSAPNAISFTVNPRPSGSIAGNQTICEGQPAYAFVNLSSGTGPWNVMFSDGSSNNGITFTSFQQQFNPTATTTYTITQITDANNCSSLPGDLTGSAVVTVNSVPAIISQPVDYATCSGGIATFTVGTGSNNTYQWQLNGTDIPEGGVYSGTETNTLLISNVTGLAGGSYTVIVSDTSSCGFAPVTSNAVTIIENNTNSWSGAIDQDWNNTGNWSCGTLPTLTTNVIIPATAPNMPLVNITNAQANNITIDAGASLMFTGTTNELQVAGNITDNGTFDASLGTVVLLGTGTQNVPGVTYGNLDIMGGSVKTLDGDATVTGVLTLSNGHIVLDSNDLMLSTPWNQSGGSPSSFIVTNDSGNVVGQGMGVGGNPDAVTFHVGTSAGSYNPIRIENLGDVDTFMVRIVDSVYVDGYGVDPTTVTNPVVNKTWMVSENTAGGSIVNMTPFWNHPGDEINGFDTSHVYVAHYMGGMWTSDLDSALEAPGAMIVGNMLAAYEDSITSLSPFTVASSGPFPLTIKLMDVSAANAGNRNKVDWKSASETIGDSYVVETSVDGKSFTQLATVQANGKPSAYTYWHETPVTGVNYYRIKTVDADNKTAYSKVVSATVKATGIFAVEAFPNPVTSTVTVMVKGTVMGTGYVTVNDVTGKVIKSAVKVENNKAEINLGDVASGVYFINYTDDANHESIKINKQ